MFEVGEYESAVCGVKIAHRYQEVILKFIVAGDFQESGIVTCVGNSDENFDERKE